MTSSEMYHAVDPKLYPDDWVNHQKTIFEQLQDDFLEDETNVMPYDWVPPRESYYTSFLPARFPTTVLPEFPRHAWLMLYGYDPCQELDRQEIFKVTKASEARNLIETRAVTWLERTIRLTGMKNRPFSAIKDAKSSVQVHGKEWRQEQTDFAFTYGGNSKEQQDNVVAILRVRTPGVLMSRDWDRPQRAEHMIAREARTLAKAFNTNRVMFFDAMKLVIFQWDRFADPVTDTVQQVYELDMGKHPTRIRAAMLRVICEGLDEKVGWGQWF